MTEEDLAHVRAERKAWREVAYEKHQEVLQLRQEKQTLQEALKEAMQAIEGLRMYAKNLEGQVEVLQERVKTLERQAAKDSHNSSLPPSSDRFVRVPKSLRKKSGKKPGGQPGHAGHALRQVQTPDEIVVHRVECCAHCQHDLSTFPPRVAERRQVFDLPVKRLWITEHQAQEKQCPACWHLTRAPFPAEVTAPAQYGSRVQTIATYLVASQCVPYARASQLLQDLFGVDLSPASIARFIDGCHQHLAEWEAALKTAILKVRVLHQDETGMRVGKEGWWVHVCATERLTHYGANPSRGREGMDAIGIAPLYEGISVHDALPSYHGYRFTEAFCNVHHLRDLTFIEEELKQDWAKTMKELLLEMKETVEQARVRGQPELEIPILASLLTRYDQIIQAGYEVNPFVPKQKREGQKRLPGRAKQNPARNLLDRFSTRKWEVLRFLLDFTVPFDNNQAERDLRMIKVQQKVSGCFRSPEGIVRFCRIRSYLSTLHKQGIPIFSALEQALIGHPVVLSTMT